MLKRLPLRLTLVPVPSSAGTIGCASSLGVTLKAATRGKAASNELILLAIDTGMMTPVIGLKDK
jgi:hypothetical protein